MTTVQPAAAAEAEPAVAAVGKDVRRWTIGAMVVWTALLAGSLAINVADERHRTQATAVEVARGAIERDLAYRDWAAAMGGLYVPRDLVAPNPALDFLPDRDVVAGPLRLTLVNPAYMVRLVYEQPHAESVPRAHLVGPRPSNPVNAADAWEAGALTRVAVEDRDVWEEGRAGGRPVLRLLRGLHADQPCLKCHARWGAAPGALLGGISASIPLEPFLALERTHRSDTVELHLAIWLVGMAGILFAGSVIGRQVRAYQVAEAERDWLQRQLFVAKKLESLGRLSGGLAHDFNNLLTPILGHVQLAMQDLPADAPVRQDLGAIEYAAGRARELTRSLMAFGRQQVAAPAPVRLGDVALSMEPLLRRLIGEDITVTVEVDPDAPPGLADRAQVDLALLNLALNARDAMPTGGRLTIRTGARELGQADGARLGLEPGVHPFLECRDTGQGMSPEVQARLFEPFFTTKGRGSRPGTGLGLASVHGAVRQVGGAIDVESAPGKGAAFTLLYRPTAVATGPGADAAPPVSRGRERILLVEDDEQVRAYTRAALRQLGYQVHAAATPDEALQYADPFDLLVSDVVLPGMSGPELWDRLTARGCGGARVLFVSGYAADANVPGDGRLLLMKPFTPAELGRAVQRALADPAPGWRR